MVSYHVPETPRVIVVKRRRGSAPLTRTVNCLWPGCGAELARDHPEPVCTCHINGAYRLPHDGQATNLLLHLLLAAYPRAVDLCGLLHCTAHELQAPLNRLRRQGHVISGARRGYVYEIAPYGDRGRRVVKKMKA